MAGNGQTVIDLDAKRMAASVAKDYDALNQLIGDDLIYIHSSARMDTKASATGAMQSGATVYTAMTPSDVVAQDLGDAVVLTGVCAISVVSGGKPNSFKVRFIDVYETRQFLADGDLAVDAFERLNAHAHASRADFDPVRDAGTHDHG